MHLNLYATDEERERIAQAEKRADRITNSAIAAILIAVTAGVGYWLYGQHVRAVRLETQGQRIAGQLEYDYTKLTRTKSGEVRYEVKYWFAIGSETYRGSGMLLNRPHSEQATIIYDPVDPNNNYIEGGHPFPSTWPESLAIVIVLYLFSGISYLHRKFKRRKQRKEFVPGIHR